MKLLFRTTSRFWLEDLRSSYAKPLKKEERERREEGEKYIHRSFTPNPIKCLYTFTETNRGAGGRIDNNE